MNFSARALSFSLVFSLALFVTSLCRAGSNGVYLSLGGDPAPSTVGINGYYYLTDYLRANAGVGVVGIGIGLKAVMPGWEMTPVVGFGYAVTYLGKKWAAGGYGSLGVQLFAYSRRSLEGGLNCTPDLFKGDYGACSAYLNFGWPLDWEF